MSAQAVSPVHEERQPPPVARPAAAGPVARWAPVVAAAMAILPILVAPIRANRRGWMPYGDDAYFSVRAWDVFSRDIPLLGTSSSGTGRVTRYGINHPGPLQFDLLAVPVRLLGHDLGTALGQALVNAAALAVVAWLCSRLLGRAGAAVAMAGGALLVWSMGSEVLYRPWGPYAVVLPFLLFLVAVWCSLAGDRAALVVLVVAGSYCLQTHLSYALLVPGLVLLAAGWTIVRLVRPAGAPGGAAAPRRALYRGAGLAVLVGAVAWTQPVIDQIAGRGNLAALARSAGGGAATPGLGPSIRRLAETVALPPAWLPPTFSSPPGPMDPPPPMGTAAPALVLLAGATAVLAWRAARRGSHAVAAGGVTSLAALVLGLGTLVRSPLFAGIPIHQILWLWPLGLFAWLVIAVALVDELASLRTPPRLLAGAACAVAVIAGIAAVPARVGIHEPFAWARPGVRAIEDDVVEAVRGKGPILVEMPHSESTTLLGPAMLPALQRAGVPFLVRDDTFVRTLGERRRFEEGDAAWQLTFVGDAAPEPPGPQHRLVARWTDLSDEVRAEFGRLNGELRSALVATGVPLLPGGAERVADAGFGDVLPVIENARSDPDEVLDEQALHVVVSWVPILTEAPVVDADRFPVESVLRWIELREMMGNRHLSVYLGPVEEGRPSPAAMLRHAATVRDGGGATAPNREHP